MAIGGRRRVDSGYESDPENYRHLSVKRRRRRGKQVKGGCKRRTKKSSDAGFGGACGSAKRRRLLQQRGLGRLKNNVGLIKVLADKRLPKKLRAAIAKNAPQDLVASVSDCCRNVLNGRVKLTPLTKRQLAVHARAIRFLASPNVGQLKKRRLLASPQRGGFLATLLAAAIPAVVSLLAERFRK